MKEEKSIQKFEGLIVYLPVLGKYPSMMPGNQEIKNPEMKIDCLVKADHQENIIDDKFELNLNVDDCTFFTVHHLNIDKEELKDPANAEKVFENSIFAISETIIWNKSIEKVGKVSSFSRQIGLVDIKYCLIYSEDGLELIWKNDALTSGKNMLNILGGIFPNMINKSGPAENPVPYISRRLLNVVDLINLAFYSEAFISSFSLLDDLVQEVVKEGLEKKGMEKDQQNQLLRAIKEDRLNHYLNNILPLCDWEGMNKNNSGLFKKLKKINTLRNNIVHNSRIINRDECVTAVGAILDSINWLRTNPFGYHIPDYPILNPIKIQFTRLEKNTDNKS